MELWDIRDAQGMVTGRTIERGLSLGLGEYHLVVFIILRTAGRKYLISKRAENKIGAGSWETVGGSVLAGEESLEGAIREVGEEVGLKVTSQELRLLDRNFYHGKNGFILDVYLYEGHIDVTSLKLQVEEVSAVQLISEKEMMSLLDGDCFFNGPLFKVDYYQ